MITALQFEKKIIEFIQSPTEKTPNQGKTVLLEAENHFGRRYNVVRFLDLFWALSFDEGRFDCSRMEQGQSSKPVFAANTIEEIGWILNLAVDGTGHPSMEKLVGREVSRIRDNLYFVYLFESRRIGVDLTEEPPHFKNARIPRVDLFAEEGEPITVISPAPSRSCNYRCHYCYHHDHGFLKHTDATEQWSESILTLVDKVKRPVRFSAGSMGEPLFNPIWRRTAKKLLSNPKVLSLAFVSNLSMDVRPFLEEIDATKLGIMASLHPSEFKNHDADFATFLSRLEYLKHLGVDLVVNYVLSPDQISRFHDYRKTINDLGVPVTSNVLRGRFNGKLYPEDFSPAEMKMIQECYDKNSYIFDSQSHRLNTYGVECISGRTGFYLEYNGDFFNCHFARQYLGSVFDSRLMIRTENSYCTSNKCESQTTIGWQRQVSDQFEVQRTMHHYVQRSTTCC